MYGEGSTWAAICCSALFKQWGSQTPSTIQLSQYTFSSFFWQFLGAICHPATLKLHISWYDTEVMVTLYQDLF